jgi:hypothetical protein
MSWMIWPAIGLCAAGAGTWLGIRRMAAGTGALVIGAFATPLLTRGFAGAIELTGVRLGLLAHLLLGACIGGTVVLLCFRGLNRVLADSRIGSVPWRERIAGLSLGLAHTVLAWFVLFPAVISDEEPSLLHAPLRELRALRILSSLSASESETLARRPEIQALVGDERLVALANDAELCPQLQDASNGSLSALAALLTDSRILWAMDHPDLLAKIRKVDLPSLADEVLHMRTIASRTAPR